MSAPNSEYQGYVRRPSGDYLGHDYPMSSNQARYTANNLRHLHDVSFQHRVNFMAPDSTERGEFDFALTTDYSHVVTFVFPWSFDMHGLPATPVLKLAGSVDSGVMTVNTYINPHGPKAPPANYDSDAKDYMFTFSSSTSSATVDLLSNGEQNGHSQITDSYRGYALLARYPQTYEEHDGTTPNAEVFLLRMSLYARVNTGTPDGQLYAISLRETVYR